VWKRAWLIKAQSSFRTLKIAYFLSLPKLCEVLNQAEPYNGMGFYRTYSQTGMSPSAKFLNKTIFVSLAQGMGLPVPYPKGFKTSTSAKKAK
jgi:hypothetical protein